MKDIFKFLLPILKPYKWHYFMMFQIPMVSVAFYVLNGYALKLIVDTSTNGATHINKWDIIYPILILISIALFQEIICRAGQWAFNKSQPFIRGKIVSKAYEYVQNHSYTYFQNTQSGSIASKIKGIVAGYDDIFEYVWWKITNPFAMCVFGSLSLAFINFNLCLLVFAWCIIYFTIIVKMSFRMSLLATQSNDLKHELIGIISDNITNIFTVLSFASKQKEFKKISGFACGEVADSDYKKNLYNFKFSCVGAGLFLGMISSVFGYTAYLRYINHITVGDFAYIVTIMYKIVYDIWLCAEQVGGFIDKVGDFKSSFSILKTPHEMIDKQYAKPLKVTKGRIEFNDVTFHYNEGNNIFENKNVVIAPGSKVGLVGFSGSGKTTFVNLILRFFDVESGQILIDGQNIEAVTQDSLHEQISMIPQDTSLFHRSLMENIRYGRLDASNEEVIAASKRAHCHEFINILPEGYESLVGERGIKLSGGQRQRIAIARAMLKNAPILILDEATSALDSVTEKQIQEGLHDLMKGCTTIVIAHRLSTLSEMDRILVFDKGHIIEDGTHEKLLKLKGHYARMWNMQAGGFLPEVEEI